MAQVIIGDILPYTQATAIASQTVFMTNWTANYTTDVVVYYTPMGTPPNDVTQILTSSQFSVAFIGSQQQVQVTLVTPANAGDIITITRQTPADRENLYSNTNFTPDMLNQDFGILTLVDQQAQLVDQLVAPRYNYSADITPVADTILPILGPNEIWVKNSAGTAIVAVDAGEAAGGVAEVDTGLGLTGGPITSTGTISFATMPATTLWANATNATALPTQYTFANLLKVFQPQIPLTSAGDPNGSVAGTTYQFCWDTVDAVLYVCTTTGSTSSAVWTSVNDTGDAISVETINFIGGNGANSIVIPPSDSNALYITDGVNPAAYLSFNTATKELQFPTNASFIPLTYSVGTITQGSYTVTGSGTTFTSAMTGGWLVPATGNPFRFGYAGSPTVGNCSILQTIAPGTSYTLYYFPATSDMLDVIQPCGASMLESIGVLELANPTAVMINQGLEVVHKGLIADTTFNPNLIISLSQTVTQTTTTITGTGTSFDSTYVGRMMVFGTGQSAFITGYTSSTSLTAAVSQTVPATFFYLAGYGGSGANNTTCMDGLGNMGTKNLYVYNSITFPVTANELLYGNSSNLLAGLPTLDYGILATSSTGVPSITRTIYMLPSSISALSFSDGVNDSYMYFSTNLNRPATKFGEEVTIDAPLTMVAGLPFNSAGTTYDGTNSTASQSGTLVTADVSNVFTSNLIGGTIYWPQSQLTAMILAVPSTNTLTVNVNQSVSASGFTIYYGGINIDSYGIRTLTTGYNNWFYNIDTPPTGLGNGTVLSIGPNYASTLNITPAINFITTKVNTGTLGQSGVTVTFSGVTASSSWIGGLLVPASGNPEYITNFTDGTHVSASLSQTIAGGTSYTLYYFTGSQGVNNDYDAFNFLFQNNFAGITYGGSGDQTNQYLWNGSGVFTNGLAIADLTTIFKETGSGYSASQTTTTVTASTSYFGTGDVGRLIMFAEGQTAFITGYTNATTVTVTPSQTVAAQQFVVIGKVSAATAIDYQGNFSTNNIYYFNDFYFPIGIASNGGIPYCNSGILNILSGTATADQMLMSGASGAPQWSTSTYPLTNAVNTLLYASSANVMAALATADNGALVTSSGGVPSILALGNLKLLATNSSGTIAARAFSVNVQTFVASGTYTPSTGMIVCEVVAVAGGGAGGGATVTTSAQYSAGAGGGAGEIGQGIFSAATIGASQTVTIGAAGTPASATTGGAGGTTSLGALLTALGGSGGGVTSTGSGVSGVGGGAGGTGGTGGFLHTAGNQGEPGWYASSATFSISGDGASGPYGSGGKFSVTSTTGSGNAGRGNGSGGAGSANGISQSALSGGAGSIGIMVITEYIIN